MAILTDENLSLYKKNLDDLSTQIKAWKTYLANAEKTIGNTTGSTFRQNYAKGKKATNRIKDVIDILQTLQKDLNTLITDAETYYTTAYNASKK